jgi:4-diphosphocytidyl-2-C-methyl-D-erythritol kinase
VSTSNDSSRYIAHAHAKINLGLEVLRRRRDGYHEIETIFQTITLFDELDIALNDSGAIDIRCSDPDIPTDHHNLCFRAVKAMRAFAGEGLGAAIQIKKEIPHGAGLGGGSSDAAAVILAVDQGLHLGISTEKLEKVALGLGSDVPYMLYGGTILGRGRGEKLTKLAPLKGGIFLIVKPPVDISTEWVYKNFNFRLTKYRYRFNLKAVNTVLARFPKVDLTFRNALEDIVCPSFPLVSDVLEELLASRPRFASMSGSGSALFAVFDSEARALQLADDFSARGFYSAVAAPHPRAIELYPVATRKPGYSKGGASWTLPR